MRKSQDIRLIWETYENLNENLQEPAGFAEMVKKFKQEGVENLQRIKGELSRCPDFNMDQFDMIHSILVEDQYKEHVPYLMGTFTLQDNKYDPTHRNDTVKFRSLERLYPGKTDKDIFIQLSLHIVYDLKGDCSIKTAKWSLQIPESINAGAIINNLAVSCTGRNIAFRKDIFNQVEGYIGNENIMSGDDDLLLQKFALLTDKKIKYSINPNSLVNSYAPISFNDFIKQRLRFASKGLLYYRIKTTIELKSTIVILFLSNLIFVFSLFNLFNINNLLYIIPISIKVLGDFSLSWVFVNKLDRYWSLSAFTILTLLHPFYIIIIGFLGPLLKVDWNSNSPRN